MDRRPFVVALVLSLQTLLAACGPGVGASSPPGSVPPAPSSSPAVLDSATLRLRLLSTFGPLWYCDPDAYPVARDDEATIARRRFGDVVADTATWTAIATSLGLDAAAPTQTPEAQLAAYRLWKQLAAMGLQPAGGVERFDLRFGPGDAGGSTGEHVVGTISPRGDIVVERREPTGPPPCPICLAADTPIAGPAGPVAVSALRPSDIVWSVDRDGARVPATVIEVASNLVPSGHRLVRLVLADGRSVAASPGHPLPDGRALGSLVAGDQVDGSVVRSTELILYTGGRTWDLRISGPTGVYLAGDGIPLASTLGR